jgi:hypothetical protein
MVAPGVALGGMGVGGGAGTTVPPEVQADNTRITRIKRAGRWLLFILLAFHLHLPDGLQ